MTADFNTLSLQELEQWVRATFSVQYPVQFACMGKVLTNASLCELQEGSTVYVLPFSTDRCSDCKGNPHCWCLQCNKQHCARCAIECSAPKEKLIAPEAIRNAFQSSVTAIMKVADDCSSLKNIEDMAATQNLHNTITIALLETVIIVVKNNHSSNLVELDGLYCKIVRAIKTEESKRARVEKKDEKQLRKAERELKRMSQKTRK
eukprot:TRINITY_DN11432_c0_g1_i1.p1 TRINITY_DN11432_c0_g1~~TRINITY_DN11432_c0_g1_i1.p1  ORF type:complete len:231 (+),score=31.31 TRINITY_DN11432_c0_g1_i1:79-693(+)